MKTTMLMAGVVAVMLAGCAENHHAHMETDNPHGEGGAHRPGMTPEVIMAFDSNKDGEVTKEEMEFTLEHMFQMLDANDDGAIDKSEAARLSEMKGHSHGQQDPI